MVSALKNGIICLEEYQGALTKIKHQCSAGHIWSIRPSLIKQGYSCPLCARLKTKRAVYKNKPTWLYYIYIHTLDIHKVGVTMETNPGCKERYKNTIIENNYDVICETRYQDGWEALQLEQHIINSNVDKKWEPNQRFGGYTECFFEDIKPNLLDLNQISNLLV